MTVDEAAENATNEIKETLFGLLTERFEDDIEFGPIVVIPRYDFVGVEYLHSYIVFQGDLKKLDPLWTLRLSDFIWPRAEELGYPGIPIQSYVSRKEWPATERWLQKYVYGEW